VETIKFAFAIIMIILMFGCTPQFAENNNISRTYEGHHIDEVIKLWGDPVKSFVAPNGNTVYVYYKADIKTQKDMDYGGYGSHSWVRSHITKVDICTTYFETNSSRIIVRHSYEGNACKGK
jgi:hypothetical protein